MLTPVLFELLGNTLTKNRLELWQMKAFYLSFGGLNIFLHKIQFWGSRSSTIRKIFLSLLDFFVGSINYFYIFYFSLKNLKKKEFHENTKEKYFEELASAELVEFL